MDGCGSTRVPRVEPGVAPGSHPTISSGPVLEPAARKRNLPHFEIPGSTYHVTWQTHNKLALSPEARARTLQACHFWHGKKIKCLAACVMPDHVHLLIQPLPIQEAGQAGAHSLSEILHSIKSFSAHEVNKVMKRTGPVWMDESFDRMIRSEADLHKTWDYIWNNPRRIGLVGPAEEYPDIWTPAASDTPQSVRRDAGHDPRDAGATRQESNRQNSSHVFLLHGVTGCGKTEIYLQALAHALEQGKGAIVLVPEISLTPQTVERFKARFSSGKLQTLVAVLHSHLVRRRTSRRMAQDPAGPRAHRHRRALGDFCAGRTARPHHRGRGARAHLQAGGSAALSRARRGHHARPDGKRRRRARLGHAVAGKFLQLQTRQIHAARTAGARGRPENAARPRRGHAAGRAQGKGHADFFAATQGSHHAAARTRRADDFVFEPARLFDFAAMPEVRLRLRIARIAASRSRIIGRSKSSPATFAVTSKKFRRSARTRNAKIRRSALPAPARKKSRKRSRNFFPRRASSAWTPTR